MTAIAVAFIVEVLRYAFDPNPYVDSIWGFVASSLVVNLGIHWFNPAVNCYWTVLSAAYNQTTLPYTALFLVRELSHLIPGLIPPIPR